MTIDRLKRVIWRLQEIRKGPNATYSNKDIRLAIMEECGTDERTILSITTKLIELKMLAPDKFGYMKITLNG